MGGFYEIMPPCRPLTGSKFTNVRVFLTFLEVCKFTTFCDRKGYIVYNLRKFDALTPFRSVVMALGYQASTITRTVVTRNYKETRSRKREFPFTTFIIIFFTDQSIKLQGRVKIRRNEWVNEKDEEQFYSS